LDGRSNMPEPGARWGKIDEIANFLDHLTLPISPEPDNLQDKHWLRTKSNARVNSDVHTLEDLDDFSITEKCASTHHEENA
jgi:hypothetical protein